jgi:hypothetical protein
MFEAPDIRPLNASDISAANRSHDECSHIARGFGCGSGLASVAEWSLRWFNWAGWTNPSADGREKMAKKNNANPLPKLTETEQDLLSHIQGGYRLEIDSLGGNLVPKYGYQVLASEQTLWR